MMPPPPPPRPGTNGSTSTKATPPPPPPRQRTQVNSQRFPTHSAPSTQEINPPSTQTARTYEPYGAVPSMPSMPTSGMAHRRTSGLNDATSPANNFGYPTNGSTTSGSSSYVLPPSTYGKPAPLKKAAGVSSQPQQEEDLQYQHNFAASMYILPSLLSILWWHESKVILQIFLFLGLILYSLDLINARDSVAVVTWISALLMTMASGFGTLLQVDDSEASGMAMILYLARLSVEGMLFCTMVRKQQSRKLLQYLAFTRSFEILPRCLFLVVHRLAGLPCRMVGCIVKYHRWRRGWKKACML